MGDRRAPRSEDAVDDEIVDRAAHREHRVADRLEVLVRGATAVSGGWASASAV